MARTHGRLKVSIWDDPDFLALKVAEQHAYFALMSNKGLSRCGVIDFIPSRFEGLAVDLTAPKFKAAVTGLERHRFVVIDPRTQELLLRSHVRHDGVFDRANMGKAVGTAYEAVVSPLIRHAIGDELARLMKEAMDLPGWIGLAATSPEAHAMACGIESRIA
jgi:hypothetical protein